MTRRTGSRVALAIALAVTTSLAVEVAVDPPVATAAGNPDIVLTKSTPAETLLGAPVEFTLRVENPTLTPGYNLSFNDTLPPGVTYVSGSADPEPEVLPLSGGTTRLVWENVADSLAGTVVELRYQVVADGTYDVADSVVNSANAYVHLDPRALPRFNPSTGLAVAGSFTGSDSATATTTFVPFRLTKSEPSAEAELLRGVHDHQTVYTLTVENNLVNPTTGFSIVDFVPAGLEFLGCGDVDNSSTEEYAGSGPINPGNAPALANPCPTPSSVSTVTTDPDGAGPLPNAVYTRVEWDSTSLAAALGSADLAPGATFRIDYVAAIPLRANVDVPLADPIANLDNNTGPPTTEDGGELELRNHAIALGDYDGATPFTDEATSLVTAEDVSIHKTSNLDSFDQSTAPVFTLLVESSEYSTGTGPIVVTDTLPSALDFVSSSPVPDGAPVVQPDGTLLITWTLPAFTSPSSQATITVDAQLRDFYRDGTGGNSPDPVAARDQITNVADLTATSDTIVDAAGGTITADVADDSNVTLTASGITIRKEVGEPQAAMPPCGDGSAITFTTGTASEYRPGDRVCWRLTIDFPANLDFLTPVVTDFLPAGFSFVSQQFGAGHSATVTVDQFSETAPVLVWELDDVDATTGALTFEAVVETIVSTPAAFEGADLLENLMKVTHTNTAGDVFQFRDPALAEVVKPIVALDKGVIELNGAPVAGAPADGVQVQETDQVTYQVRVTNTGGLDALDVSVRDILPPGISCADVSAISNGGACTSNPGRDHIQWDRDDDVDVPVGGSVSLTYAVTVPVGVSAGALLVNEAGVREYGTTTNRPAPDDEFQFVPADNIDPTLTPLVNTDPADDTSSIVTDSPTVAKSRTTELTEAGNGTTDEATIGEVVTYTLTLDLAAGLTYYDATLTDVVDARLDLVAPSVSATLDGAALPAAGVTLAVDDAGNRLTVDFPTVYDVPAGADQQIVVAFDAIVRDVPANVRNTSVPNRVDFDWADASGATRNTTASVGTRIVEPNVVLDKRVDDADGIVDAGQTVTYTVTVSNDDAVARVSTAHDTVVVDTVPAQLIVQPATISNAGTFDPGTNTITWTVATLAPGASIDLTYDVVVADPVVAAGELTNDAIATTTSYPGTPGGDAAERTATSPDGGPGSGYQDPATATVTVPRLAIRKDATPETATVGEPVAYTLDVTIPGGVIGYDVTVIDQVPAGIVFESLTSVTCDQVGSPCTPDITGATVIPAGPYASGDDLAFFLGDLTAGAADDRVVTITYVGVVADAAAAASGAALTNSATVVWNASDTITTPPTTVPALLDFDAVSDPSSDTVDVVEPRLVIDKDVAGQTGDTDTRRARPGDVLAYSLVVTNTGTSAAHDVVVTDVVTDPTWAFVHTSTDPAVTITDGDPVGGLAWSIPGPIAPGNAITITYELTVPPGFDSADENPAGPEQTNTADVPSYWGVPEVDRQAEPDRDHREYDDVTPDTVTIELDLASIGDRVWFDVDGDGVQDAGEPGLPGVTVTVTYLGPDGVLGGGDDEVFTTVTDATGTYLVEDLPGGAYVVTVDPATIPIAGLTPSYDLDGGTTSPDGTWIGALGEDQDRRDVDAGYTGTGSIGDTIWFDQDGDGVQDAGEAGLPGVDVTVTWFGPDGVPGGGDDIVATTTTDADGNYLVGRLPAGEYGVVVDATTVPEGMTVVSDPDGVLDGATTLTLGVGETNLDQDVGYRGSGSIGDRVWLDQDGDGVQDPGEPGLVGVSVQVTSFGPDGVAGGSDDSTFVTTTGPDGAYLVEFLPPGTYRVDVLGGLPSGVVNTGDPDGGDDSTALVTLTAAAPDDLDQDFGYDADSVLGDRVWWDLNRDGVQDPGEPGIPGVELTLTGPNGLVLTTTTDAAGDYLVVDLPDGSWTVAVTGGVPAGFDPTFDADGGLDQTSTTVLATSDLFQDFGYAGTSTIGDTLWLDLNGDGVQDADEPGIENVTIELTWYGPDGTPGGGDDVVLTTVTDADGQYLFDALPAGEYEVRVDETSADFPVGATPSYDRDGGTATPDGVTPVTLGTGDDVDDVDFGYVGGASIGDTIWLDRDGDGDLDGEEVGIGGVTVTLVYFGEDGVRGGGDDETFTTTTAPDGTYLFAGLPAGEFLVVVDPATLPPGVAPTFDPDGSTPNESRVTLTANQSDLDQDFGYRGAGSIGDTIWLDLDGDGTQGPDEPGVPGQTVTLTWDGPTGPETFTTTTAPDGTYLFDFLPDGDYTVTVVAGIVDAAVNTGDPDGGTPNASAVTLTGGEANLDQDFGYQGTNAIGDTVWFDVDADGVDDADEPRLAGVEITIVWLGPDGVPGGGDDLTFPIATTDVDGDYLVGALPDGTVTVTVTGGLPAGIDTVTYDGDDGATAPDGTSTVVDLGVGSPDPVADLDQDLGYTGSGSIGDTVWLDLDGDGALDPGEPGIPGAQVTLTWAGFDGLLGTADDVLYPTTTTDADGRYTFEHLPAGSFRVDVAGLPAGLTPTADPDGGADSRSELLLAPGASNQEQDFGYRGAAAIGDTVWLDVDRDGEQDANEPGLSGITVTVTAAGADGVLGTADDIVVAVTTDADGNYRVDGLPAGPTQVAYDPSTLEDGLAPSSDLDGGPPTTTVVELEPGSERLDVDFAVAGTSSISGTVWIDLDADGIRDAGETGIPGVSVEVTWNGPDGPVTITVVTDADGNWSLDDVPSGDYETSVVLGTVPAGLVPTTPVGVEVEVPLGGTASTVNGLVPAASVGDRVWLDIDRDGVQDPGERGASGVVVELVGPDGDVIATTTTDADGTYLFEGLVPGTYTIRLAPGSLGAGLVVVADPDGTRDGVHTVTLTAGQELRTVDFGLANRTIPTTGSTVLDVVLLALALLFVGGSILGWSRRRRPATGQ